MANEDKKLRSSTILIILFFFFCKHTCIKNIDLKLIFLIVRFILEIDNSAATTIYVPWKQEQIYVKGCGCKCTHSNINV